ncbi:radical SAM protein [Gemmatimonadota bacterium]
MKQSELTIEDVERLIPGDIEGPDRDTLFRYPWSNNDNPQGWVEITDACNLECHGCYRLRRDGHKPLDEIKQEILFLKKWRNVDSITLAGGEPLIHPDIVEIVSYISEQGLKAMSLSNGVALNETFLRELKKAGLVKISFHIDAGQNRKDWAGKTEEELNELRQYFVDLLWQEQVKCNFNITVTLANFQIISMLINWCLGNRGRVDGFTFILARGIRWEGFDFSVNGKSIEAEHETLGMVTDVDPENFKIKSDHVYRYIKSAFPDYEASAFLGGTVLHDSYKWLISVNICSGNRIFGSVGPGTMKLVQQLHHLFRGRYMIVGKGNLGRKMLLLAPVDRMVRKAFLKLFSNPVRLFRKVYTFGINIIQPCDFLPDGSVNMCESCPDLTLYKGKLVHSCRLEEYRLHGKFVTISPIVNEKP